MVKTYYSNLMRKSILKLECKRFILKLIQRSSFSDFLNFIIFTTFRFASPITFTIIFQTKWI